MVGLTLASWRYRHCNFIDVLLSNVGERDTDPPYFPEKENLCFMRQGTLFRFWRHTRDLPT